MPVPRPEFRQEHNAAPVALGAGPTGRRRLPSSPGIPRPVKPARGCLCGRGCGAGRPTGYVALDAGGAARKSSVALIVDPVC